MVTKTTLTIVGENKMNCGGCERSVTAALAALPEVQSVTADRLTQAVTVLGAAPVEQLKAELAEIGYQAEVA